MSIFQSNLLNGKTAFVTGGGTGICKGIAAAFAAHGADVAISSRKQPVLDEAAKEMAQASGQKVVGISADVRDFDAVGVALDKAVEAIGPLDIIVNGAAGNFLCPAAGLSSNGFKTVMDIDSLGTFNVCRAAFDRGLADQKGLILNISATLHYGATPFQLHASAAKAAVDALTRNLAVEWGGLGIRVNGIAPGPIADTVGMDKLAPPEVRQRLTNSIPLKRLGTTHDVAQAALFLASDGASYITGTTLVVDGGHWLTAAGLLG